jgi:butyrophilin
VVFLECAGLFLLRFTHYCLSAWATEPFFPKVSPWKPAFFVTLTMMGLLVLGTSYLFRRERSARLIVQELTGNLQRVEDNKAEEDTVRTIGKSP